MKIWDALCFIFIIGVIGTCAFLLVNGLSQHGEWLKSAILKDQASNSEERQLIRQREVRFNTAWQALTAFKDRSNQGQLQLAHELSLVMPVSKCCTLLFLNVQGSVVPMRQQAQSLNAQAHVIHVALMQAALSGASLDEDAPDPLIQRLSEIDRLLDAFEKGTNQLEHAYKNVAQKVAKANSCLMAYAP